MGQSYIFLNFHKSPFNMPVYNPSNIPPTLLETIEMAQSDTRELVIALESLQASNVTTQATLTATQATVNVVNATLGNVQGFMTQPEQFTIPKDRFNLVGTVRVQGVTHGLSVGQTQMTLIDSTGDIQGFAQLIAVNSTQAAVELSATQWNDNAYPLTLLIHGRKPIQPTVRAGVSIGAGGTFSLLNGSLAQLVGAVWTERLTNVTAARYRNNRIVAVVGNNMAAPMILQSANGYVAAAGSGGDWSPDENNSPQIPV